MSHSSSLWTLCFKERIGKQQHRSGAGGCCFVESALLTFAFYRRKQKGEGKQTRRCRVGMLAVSTPFFFTRGGAKTSKFGEGEAGACACAAPPPFPRCSKNAAPPPKAARRRNHCARRGTLPCAVCGRTGGCLMFFNKSLYSSS